MPNYQIEALWDAEVGVWVATSEDVPGLVTEAATIEALTDKLRIMIPELLEANAVSGNNPEISFALTSRREEMIRMAS